VAKFASGNTVIDALAASRSGGDGEANPITTFLFELQGRLDPRLVLLKAPESPRAAAFRVLAHQVRHADKGRVVLVSSPGPRQGKTLCAVNLALALGESGRARVLLVEANLRAPQLAQIFGFSPPWCFAEQLVAHREQPMQEWKVVDVGVLHVIAFSPAPQLAQLTDATAFSIAMERFLLAQYDHIVIDGPAVLGSAEVNLLQEDATCVLLTALTGRTSARELREAREQLQPGEVLGVALIEGSPGR
jgi:Mrp family chromosome partitioning ATPase